MAQTNEHEIQLHGIPYTTYPGLLAQAHGRIQSIDTDFRQYPNEENNWTTIIKAVVTDTDGKTFSGIGDANADNVSNRQIAKHSIRMAETRAKSRAFRDLLGLNVALEGEEESEVGESPASSPATRETAGDARSRKSSGGSGASAAQESQGNVTQMRGAAKNAPRKDPQAARKSQKDLIWTLVETLWPNAPEAALEKVLKDKEWETLNRQDADLLIDWLSEKTPEGSVEAQEADVDDDELEEVED